MALVWLAIALTLPLFVATRYLLGADSGHYVELARALAQGAPYEVNGRPETKYPPGFPLLLVPAALIADGSFLAIARWAAMLASLVLPASYLLAKRRMPRFAIPIALAAVSSATFINLATTNPISDLTFTAVSAGFLVWADRVLDADAAAGWTTALLGALLLTMTVAIRTIGIAAIAAFGFAVAIRWFTSRPGARWTAQCLLPLGSATLYFVLWSAWATRMRQPWYRGEGSDSYTHQMMMVNPQQPDLGQASLADIAGRVLTNVKIQGAHAGELLTQLPWIQHAWLSPLVLLPLLLILLGIWFEVRKRRILLPAYAVAYATIVVLWPFDEGRRLLFPLLPLILLFVGSAVAALIELASARYFRLRAIGAAVCGLSLIGVIAGIVPQPDPSRQELLSVAAWSGLLLTLLITDPSAAGKVTSAIRTHQSRLVTALTAVFVAAGVVRMAPEIHRRANGAPPTDPTPVALDAAATWLAAHTPPSTVVQGTFVSPLHLASRRRVVPFPLTRDPAVFREVDSLYAPQYLVVLKPTGFDYYLPLDSDRFMILRRALNIDPSVAHVFSGGWIYALR
jgi:hypothetical protein